MTTKNRKGIRLSRTASANAERAAEATLAQRISRGDQAALEEFFESYTDRLYSFIYYRVNANGQDAEDILQETLLTATEQITSFRGESRLFTWLCGIAWHKVQDFYRQKGRLDRITREAVTRRRVEFNLTEEASLAGRLETQEWVQQCLNKLSLNYQAVLVLKYVEGFSVAEIAEIMKKSPKAVDSLLTRAREAFRAATLELPHGEANE